MKVTGGGAIAPLHAKRRVDRLVGIAEDGVKMSRDDDGALKIPGQHPAYRAGAPA